MSGSTAQVLTHSASETDARFMAAALSLGRRGLGRTAPNPSVGALVVRDGIIVGRGCTGDGGRPHGERTALDQAGEAARGATLYVTLEPCSHHGRTPPCCEAIVAAGIARVVYAIDDPNPLVAGQGAAYCRAHGLVVDGGAGAAQARRDHLGHIRRMTEHRPMVTLKLAETADGFVAGGPHDPRLAITGAAANGAVHVLRAMHDAIMVGSGTVVADDPLMTVRLPGLAAKPLRIVLDRDLSLSARSRVMLTAAEAPTLVVAGEAATCPAALSGVEILRAPVGPDGRLDLGAVLVLLAARGVTRILSEGGPRVAEHLLAHSLVDGPHAVHVAETPGRRRRRPGLELGRANRHRPRLHDARRASDRRRPLAPLLHRGLMFTGLVTDVGTIEHVAEGASLKRVRLRSGYPAEGIALGASIACGGPCLTVVSAEPAAEGSIFAVEVGAETLARTTARSWREGTRLNLERSLRIGDELAATS